MSGTQVQEEAVIPGSDDFSTSRVAVVGLGISGKAVVGALSSLTSATVSVWDAREGAIAEVSGSSSSVAAAECIADPRELADAVVAWQPDIIVPAPAIAEISPLFSLARERDIPLWGEIELAWRLRARSRSGAYAPWLCVTGTNGKTTTVSMMAAMLKESGRGGVPIGNIGTPAIGETSKTSPDRASAFALELSSFQLRTIHSVSPAAAICLNIADDHLEWHGSFEAYRRAKAQIYERVQTACVFPVGDAVVQSMVDDADVHAGARAIGVTTGVPQIGQIGIVENLVVDRAFGPGYLRGEAIELFTLEDLAHLAPAGGDLPLHIVKDALAAAALVRSIGVEPDDVRTALRHFAPGKHRIERVATRGGVMYVDDSKATNAHAAQAAISAQKDGSVVWIVGGLAKGARFDELVAAVRAKLRGVVVIGRDQEVWKDALRSVSVPTRWISPDDAQPMISAVAAARDLACVGDTVLLAPATASFDQFASYADRGDRFREAVELLHETSH